MVTSYRSVKNFSLESFPLNDKSVLYLYIGGIYKYSICYLDRCSLFTGRETDNILARVRDNDGRLAFAHAHTRIDAR